MICPKFNLDQSLDSIKLDIKCPFIKTSQVEIDVDGNVFRFYCKPFFLRLNFSGELTSEISTSYDVDSHVFSCIVKKLESVEFKDLDLLTKLLDIKEQRVEIQDLDPVETCENLEIDWSFPQEIQTLTAGYGFNNLYQGYSHQLQQMAHEIIEFENIENSSNLEKRNNRLLREESKFDQEYYMADFVNTEEIDQILKFKPESYKCLKRIQDQRRAAKTASENQASNEQILKDDVDFNDPYLGFSDLQKEQMLQLKNKNYLFDNEKVIYLGMVDILFAYCYNHRTTLGENTVESPWTICKLSGSLSCFEQFSNLLDVLTCFLRRSLCYPLYRNFALSQQVWKDACVILKLGKRAILKVFLEIQHLLARNDQTHVIERVWISDYCVWLQKASDKILKSLASEVNHFELKRELTGWPLKELEEQTRQD